MGDIGLAVSSQGPQVGSVDSHALPFGSPQPPNDAHAISVSMPTWGSVLACNAEEEWALTQIQTMYPRFSIHNRVEALQDVVMERFKNPANMTCKVFPSRDAANRLALRLQKKDPMLPVFTARFVLPCAPIREMPKWANFSVVVYHQSNEEEVLESWEKFGDGISSRHAVFSLAQFPFMDSECEDPQFCTAGPRSDLNEMTLPDWVDSATKEKFEIRSRLAVLARSAQFNQKPLRSEDVFLYPTGMAAISAVARSLAQSEEDSGAVVYGWPYAGTPHSVRTSGFNRFTMYGHGTTDELDELKSSLALGTKITVLFCEIPSNPQLSTPDLLRIRDLANKFRFIVVCDDTLATSVNMDIMPYVDVTVTSLTKIFSGGGNVMGGSLMVNPASQHYDKLHSLLSNSYEDLYFPPDAMIMAKNSRDFVERVHRCNESTLRIANLLTTHSSVEYVNHPTTVSSAPIYERYRRENGGYGFLLSVVFRNPGSAEVFYDTLDVWKGPTIGTNASIAIPYSLLAHAREGDWAASHGIPRHIVRLSVGLEDFTDLKTRVNGALHRVEQWEEERKSADPDGTAASGCAIL